MTIDHSPELLAESRRRWPDVRAVENHEEQGLSGARNMRRRCRQRRGGRLPRRRRDRRAGLARPPRRGLPRPEGARRRRRRRPAWVAGEPRWFPPEFDWVVGCTHSGMPQQRATVRNLVGANMSLRRAVLDEVGGFRHELGRVGTIPAGCEETDLCIRVGKRWPEGQIVYDPEAAVDHFVPRAAANAATSPRAAAARDGRRRSLAGMVGSDRDSSGALLRAPHPAAGRPARHRRGPARRLGGIARATAIVSGLLTTTRGYASAGGERRRLETPPRALRASGGDGARAC